MRRVFVLLFFAACAPPELLDEPSVSSTTRGLEAHCEAEVRGSGNVRVEDDYLPHVVACENGAADYEALRAQAIAARTFLYYKLESAGSIGDGQGDQVYSCSREPTEEHHRAVRSTSGEILRYAGTTIAAFYVAGAIPSADDCVARGEDPDRYDTERYVTYNQGRSGDAIEQSTLGWVDPGNLRNRGAKSQNGAGCLSRHGYGVRDIVQFYYGMDISVERAAGACVEVEEEPSWCEVGGKTEAFVDEVSDCVVRACAGGAAFVEDAGEGGFGGTMSAVVAAGDEERCTARWRLQFSEAGEYSVAVHVAGASPLARKVLYRVLHAGVEDAVIVDQGGAGEWAPLGSYTFAAGAEQWVEVSDRVEGALEGGELIAVDAIRVRKAGVLPQQPIVRPDPPAGSGGGEEAQALDGGCSCSASAPRSSNGAQLLCVLALLVLCLRRRVSVAIAALALAACGSSDPTELMLGPAQQSEGLAACINDSLDGTTHDGYRCATFRAIGGVSMGGGAAMRLALQNPELFDVAVSLGSPYIDMEYFLLSVSAVSNGGFCPLDQLEQNMDALDNKNDPRTWCGPVRFDAPALEDSACLGFGGDYNHHYRGTSAGRGGTFGREGSFEVVHDFAIAYGNPAFENETSDYLPPGVDPRWHVPLGLEGAARNEYRREQCANPVRIDHFYDKNYNPDGSRTVITFCDGEGPVNGEYEPGTAIFPVEVALAVDLNNNGRRDYAEPVISQGFEYFDDFGVDQLKNADEPGYDPVSNADPAGDDYDWLKNPRGTENNSRPDPGERFDDLGLDGVPNTHDRGEGNGVFDVNRNLERAFSISPRRLVESIDQKMLDRLHLWVDAGIRDFLFSAQISNQFYAALSTRTNKTSLLRGFDADYDARSVDLSEKTVNRHPYLRYGDDSFCPGVDEMNGSGNHVGTPREILARLQTGFAFASARLDEGDFKALPDAPLDLSAQILTRDFESPALGRRIPYVVILPPDYNSNPDTRYPVMYFLHGQGQKATDLAASALLLLGPQMSSDVPAKSRSRLSDWQKMIIVLADGECQLGECHTGTFYVDHQGVARDGQQFGEAFFELMRLVDATYRTKAPKMLDSSSE